MSDGGWASETPAGRSGSGARVDLASVVSVDPHTGFETEPPRASAGGRDRERGSGGYPLDQLFEEVAFVAYYFGWSHDELLALPHWERRRWCEEISAINERMNERRRRD